MVAEEPEPTSRGLYTGPLAPLRHTTFRAVWTTNLITNLGTLIQSVGASWMMATIASAQMVALVQASVSLPIMLLSLLAGAAADTFDRRIIMLIAQSFMLVVSCILAGVTWAGWINPWLLLTFTFLIGCGTAFNGPAWQASVGDMAPRQDLPAAVTLNSMGFNIARSVGPAIGGVIVAAGGAAAAFAVNAFSYVGLIFVLFRWKSPAPASTLQRESLLFAMAAGVRYARMSPRIYGVMLRAFLFGLAASGLQALMPLIARNIVSGGPSTYGALLGAFGAGAVGGAFFSGKLRKTLSNERLVQMTCATFALCAATVALSPWVLLTVPALILAGAAWVLTLSTLNVTVQMSVPRWVVARALALYQMAAFGGLAAGAWMWGAVAEAHSVSIALAISALAQSVCVLAGWWFPLPPAKDLDLDPLNRWREPQIAVPIEPRSGPIVIRIEYVIDLEDTAAFLDVMAERRRIRKRDGARHWVLMRDLGDPHLWVERYHTPTWVDYIRHNQRATKEDAAVSERIMALHQGPGRPKVQRMIERTTGVTDRDHARTAEPLIDPSLAS